MSIFEMVIKINDTSFMKNINTNKALKRKNKKQKQVKKTEYSILKAKTIILCQDGNLTQAPLINNDLLLYPLLHNKGDTTTNFRVTLNLLDSLDFTKHYFSIPSNPSCLQIDPDILVNIQNESIENYFKYNNENMRLFNKDAFDLSSKSPALKMAIYACGMMWIPSSFPVEQLLNSLEHKLYNHLSKLSNLKINLDTIQLILVVLDGLQSFTWTHRFASSLLQHMVRLAGALGLDVIYFTKNKSLVNERELAHKELYRKYLYSTFNKLGFLNIPNRHQNVLNDRSNFSTEFIQTSCAIPSKSIIKRKVLFMESEYNQVLLVLCYIKNDIITETTDYIKQTIKNTARILENIQKEYKKFVEYVNQYPNVFKQSDRAYLSLHFKKASILYHYYRFILFTTNISPKFISEENHVQLGIKFNINKLNINTLLYQDITIALVECFNLIECCTQITNFTISQLELTILSTSVLFLSLFGEKKEFIGVQQKLNQAINYLYKLSLKPYYNYKSNQYLKLIKAMSRFNKDYDV
ncbi:hypothetical protein K502DRAFT_331585 [Neoconidiobolus thromboides FSU 785]|nr:hypothetical protein K502DRAFT_331585 [Neoconidiobolus thromboides FSU 785]